MFLEKYKKILLAIGFVLAAALMGYIIYSLFFKSAPAQQTTPGTQDNYSTTTPSTLPSSGRLDQINVGKPSTNLPGGQTPGQIRPGNAETQSRISELTLTQSLGAVLTQSGLMQFYNKEDGKFYRIDNNGNATLLSDKVFHSVDKITWAPDNNKAVIEYPDGANIIYDFSSQKQVTLPNHWKDFEFSPSGNQLVMKSIGVDPGNRWLAVVNSDGTQAKKIEALGEKDETVYSSWSPSGQTVAMYTEGIDFNRQEVYFVGLNNENFKSLVVEGRGFQQKWDTGGDRLLYSVYSSDTNFNPSLWIANAKGESIGTGRVNLHVETWAEKCSFYNDTQVYCAIPNDLPENSGLFPELAKNTSDSLYQIDLATGAKKLVYAPDEDHNMSNLIISPAGDYAYFTDSQTNKIYKIKIK